VAVKGDGVPYHSARLLFTVVSLLPFRFRQFLQAQTRQRHIINRAAWKAVIVQINVCISQQFIYYRYW